MQHTTVIVVAGGSSAHQPMPAGTALPEGAFVIAADSGIDRARALGLVVDLAIGDFDSVSPSGLAAAAAAGASIVRHPVAKDATDLELALDAALEHDPERILVVGAGGGRLDHLLAVCALLASQSYAGVIVDSYLGDTAVCVIRGSRTLVGAVGEVVSLLAYHGPATGITTSGLEYPLHNESLGAGSTRGVSNVFSATEATITVTSGVLLAVQPGASS